MKKILFGLLLSVGMSGMVMANSDVNVENFKNFEKLTDCTIQTRIYMEDSNGNSMGYRDYCTQGTGSQCNGAVNGIVTKQKTVRLAGTDPNP